MDDSRFLRAIAEIDAANAADPTTVEHEGGTIAKELLYARRMSAALERLAPEASEPLRLAVRAQHIERWKIPRDRHPRDRVGYLKWRSELAKLHAARLGEILRGAGYDDETIARAQAIVQKRALARDPSAQTLEDCACIVFLEHHLEEFAAEHPEEKVIEVLRKTWAKMSDRGRSAGLRLALPARSKALVGRALAG